MHFISIAQNDFINEERGFIEHQYKRGKKSESLRLTGPTAMAEKVMPIAGNSLS